MSTPNQPTPSTGRRNFLSKIVIAVQTVIGATVAYVVGGAALAPGFAARKASWQRAASVSELAESSPTPITLRLIRQDGYRQVVDRRVVYMQRDASGAVRVLDSTCTHLGCRTRYDQVSENFVCPCHGGVYGQDGSVLEGPPPAPLRRIEARIEDGNVLVRV